MSGVSWQARILGIVSFLVVWVFGGLLALELLELKGAWLMVAGVFVYYLSRGADYLVTGDW